MHTKHLAVYLEIICLKQLQSKRKKIIHMIITNILQKKKSHNI